ncbi:MAG: nucleoside triphosphate pyrophosphohydrolase family protein [Alphaproteobacteria bacterium]|nr:nucleoside triphosphate pyrophosphohydrolase family protein [Alphaproteobacteria bacterium]
MNKYEELVKECHKAMELSIDDAYSVNLLTLRQKLINEETDELNVEINTLIDELKITGTILKETKLKMFKELADLQYVLSGMVVSLGIPMEEVFQRVHNSNMSKLVDGKPLKRADGKFLKGPNYKKPDLSDLG